VAEVVVRVDAIDDCDAAEVGQQGSGKICGWCPTAGGYGDLDVIVVRRI
jgi:hypothetical protein